MATPSHAKEMESVGTGGESFRPGRLADERSHSIASFHFTNRGNACQPVPLLVTIQRSRSQVRSSHAADVASDSTVIQLEGRAHERQHTLQEPKAESLNSHALDATEEEISRVHIEANPQFDLEFSDYVVHWHAQKDQEMGEQAQEEEHIVDIEMGSVKALEDEKVAVQEAVLTTQPTGSADLLTSQLNRKQSVLRQELIRSSSAPKRRGGESKSNLAMNSDSDVAPRPSHPLDLLFKSLPLRAGHSQEHDSAVASNAEKIHALLADVDIEKGLTAAQVSKRRTLYGSNKIEEKAESAARIFAKKFWGLSAWMLEIVVVFALAIQNWVNAAVVFALLFINALLSFWKDLKGRKAVQELKEKLKIESRARRDNDWKKLPAEEVVPGDVLRLRIGDIVPADCIVFKGGASVDQSALTGETDLKQLVIGDVVYSGSLLKNGEVSVIVVAIALNTYFGKSLKLVQSSAPAVHLNELLKQMMKSLLSLVLFMLVLAIVVSAIRGNSLLDIVPLLLMLLVSAIPVALPTMYTSAASYGAQQLSANGVLVSRLAACEDVARMTILCSDKTGTLTENKLALQDIAVQVSHYVQLLALLYQPYAPASQPHAPMLVNVPVELVNTRSKLARRMAGSCIEVEQPQMSSELHTLLQHLSKEDILLLARLASVDANHDPIDAALIQASQRLQSLSLLQGFSAERLHIHEQEFVVNEFFPFNPSTRRTEALVTRKGVNPLIFKISKGAVDTLMSECILQLLSDAELLCSSAADGALLLSQVRECAAQFRALVNAEVDRIASHGFRSIALTVTDGSGTHYWLGLLALHDPPRHDSADVIRQLNSLGIEVKMLTGDSWKVACNVAKAVGIGERILNLDEEKKVCKADVLRAMAPEERAEYFHLVNSGAKVLAGQMDWKAEVEQRIFSKLSEKYDHFLPIHGFANIYPEDKHRIVSILQQTASRTGEGKNVVGMTGDGVNDAPALKQADVGVAMSNATDIAKSAAAIVLLNEGLSSVLPLVRVGREIHKRIVTWIINKIMKTLQVAVFVVVASFIYSFYPIASFHMVLLLLLVDFVTITLATDPQAISKLPAVWRMPTLTKVGVSLGFLGVLEAFLVFQLCWSGNFVSRYNYDENSIQTIGFEIIYFFSVVSIFSVRETGLFFRTRPSMILLSIILLQTLVVVAFCSTGIPTVLASVPVIDSVVLIVVLLCFCLLFNDVVKLFVFKWTKYSDA